MSEPNSLFAKIHISKNKFDAFLSSKPQTPTLDNDWKEWWASRKMYGKSELQEQNLVCYIDETNGAIINSLVEAKEYLAFSEYDDQHEIWNFGVIMFAENYLDMIPGIAFIKSVSEFKNENNEDFAIIYNHFWGAAYVCAFINYQNGDSFFDTNIQQISDIDPNVLKYSEEYLRKKYDELAV